MWSVFSKEISSFFSSLIAYVVIGLFLTGTGLYIWVFPDTILDYGIADLSTLFQSAPFVLMFLVPGITMRMFSEEKNNGTIELLLTKPLSEWDIVLGKYFSALLLSVLALIPTLVYFFSIYLLGDPIGNIDIGGAMGSYVGLILLAAVYASIGLFTSSLTSNQIVAFAFASFTTLILFEGVDYLKHLFDWTSLSVIVSQLSLSTHYSALSKGVIDTRDLVFFGSVAFIFLLATRLVLQSRKW